LAGEQLIVSHWKAPGDGRLSRQKDVRPQQGLPDSLEDQLVKFVSARAAFSTDPISSACRDGVVLMATVVADESLATVGLQAGHAATTPSTLDESSQQVGTGLCAPWAPLRVVTTYALSGFKDLLGHNRRYWNRDPL
jgi:hypothetical protein